MGREVVEPFLTFQRVQSTQQQPVQVPVYQHPSEFRPV